MPDIVPIEPPRRRSLSAMPVDLLGREARSLSERVGGFEGESQYDTGLTYGVEQERLRAQNQPVLHELRNAAVKLGAGILLDLVENAGDIADFAFNWSDKKDYDNILTQIAKQGKSKMEGILPTYRENKNEIIDTSDSAWWVQNGQGLLQSIISFLIVGSGIGGALRKGAKALSQAIKAGKTTQAGINLAAQTGTAMSLSYLEGVQQAAQVYEKVYNYQQKDLGKTPEEANTIASESAALSAKMNTLLGTAINMTSVAPFMSSVRGLSGIKSQLSKKSTETLTQWGARINELAKQGVPQAAKLLPLIREGVQEAIEEGGVNLYSQDIGEIHGGVRKREGNTDIEHALRRFVSPEGRLNAILGAIGGILQSGGAEHLPIKTYKDNQGNERRVSNYTLEALEQNKELLHGLVDVNKDITHIVTTQKALNKAIENNDRIGVETARRDLFDVSLLNSIGKGYEEDFSNEMTKFASVDNIQFGEDQQTDAMRLGLADNEKDNQYRENATRAAGDIKILSKEYEDLSRHFTNPIAQKEAFSKRVKINSLNHLLNDTEKEIAEQRSVLTGQINNTNALTLLELNSQLKGTDIALQHITELAKEEQNIDFNKITTRIKNEKSRLTNEIKELSKNDPEALSTAKSYKGLSDGLAPSYGARSIYSNSLQQNKDDYSKILNNIPEFEKEVSKNLQNELKKAHKVQEDNNKKTEKVAEENKQKEDLNEAVKSKAETNKVFIYGTLKNPQIREQALQGEQIPTTQASARGSLSLEKDYPNFHPFGENEVEGELLTLSPEQFEKLDKWEEGKYSRKKITLTTGEKAWVYIKKDSAGEVNVGYEQLTENIPSNQYENRTVEQATEENKEIENLQNSLDIPDEYKLKEIIPNKFAYLYSGTPELTDTNVIADRFKLLHSTEFKVGSSITLKALEEGKEVDHVPIGIFYNEELVAYVPVNKHGMNQHLHNVRQAIINSPNGINTIVIKKTNGILMTTPTNIQSREAFPTKPQFVIAKDGNLHIAPDEVLPNVINKKNSTGHVYAVITSPANNKIAIHTDITKISPVIANSIGNMIQLYFSYSQFKDNLIYKQLLDEYNYDASSIKALSDYINTFIPTTDLRTDTVEGKLNIERINNEKKENYYFQVSNNGVRFIKSKGTLVDLTNESPEKYHEYLKQHLVNMFARVDLTKIKEDSPLRMPLIRLTENQQTELFEYKKDSYTDYILDNTRTNVEGQLINPTEVSYFKQPTILFDDSFVQPQKEQVTVEKTEEKTTFTFKPTLQLFEDDQMDNAIIAPDQVTKEKVEEVKRICGN